jgi:hypothetical protein
MDRQTVRHLCVAALLASVLPGATSTAAQGTAKRTREQIQASFEAHKGEFDYLLGDWEFTGTNQQYGKLRGYWSAVRLDEGQILDEYRVVGDEGETYYVTTTLRNYNGALDRWELVGADGGTGLQDIGTGHSEAGEMRIEQTFGVAAGTPSRWRIRYSDIRPDRFSWTADRSPDGGMGQGLSAARGSPPRAGAIDGPAHHGEDAGQRRFAAVGPRQSRSTTESSALWTCRPPL